VGLVVAWFGFLRLFRGAERLAEFSFTLPDGLTRYAMPMWFAEMANSLLLRLDTLVLAALTDPTTVGVWAIVSQFANALRQIRRTYDPMVTAITARIAASHDARRLSETFSYAVQMVSLTQLPVFAVFLEFSDALLPLYGAGFEKGSLALVVLSGCFLLSGGAGLAGLVVNGYGHSRLTLINVLFSIVTQFVLLLSLAPRFGLVGAALATGLSLLATNALQLYQMRQVTGSLHFTTRARFSLAISLSSVAGLAIADFTGRALALEPWTRRFTTMAVFAIVYLSLAAYGRREGFLRAPGSQVAVA
jgi:O-antigen/teichoic acid export membrane protein